MDEGRWHEHDHEIQEEINRKLDQIIRRLNKMAIDQATFDTDLAALVAAEAKNGEAVAALTAAVDAWIAAHPSVDFSAEDTAVQSAAADAAVAAQALADELAKVTPAPVEPPPAP